MTLDEATQYAPIVTAGVATIASIVALASILVQKNIARKRATLDLFLKTEMDKAMVDLSSAFDNGVEKLKSISGKAAFDNFRTTDEYYTVRSYLNVHELIALGVRRKILDEGVCYHFWSNETVSAWQGTKHFVADYRTREQSPGSYIELENLNKRWERRVRDDSAS